MIRIKTKMRRRKLYSSILVFAGVLCIISGVSLAGYNIWDDSRAGSEAENVLSQLHEVQRQLANENAAGSQEVGSAEDESQDPSELYRMMPAVTINGYGYVGTVSIPTLDIELPVMEEWDYTRMKLSPCRYSGSVYQNDLIICAHNYQSHFGRIDNLQIWDEVIITDVEGTQFYYQVAAIETLDGTAVEEMSAGNWDLTLFTCTYSGRARVTVRCNQYFEQQSQNDNAIAVE